MAVKGFPHGKGRGVELPVAGRDIVGDEIAKDMCMGVGGGHMLGRLADDHAQFGFIVDLVRDVGLDDAVIGARDRRCLLVEPELLPRLGDAELRSEEHTSALQSLMRNSYDVFCLQQKTPLYSNGKNTT